MKTSKPVTGRLRMPELFKRKLFDFLGRMNAGWTAWPAFRGRCRASFRPPIEQGDRAFRVGEMTLTSVAPSRIACLNCSPPGFPLPHCADCGSPDGVGHRPVPLDSKKKDAGSEQRDGQSMARDQCLLW